MTSPIDLRKESLDDNAVTILASNLHDAIDVCLLYFPGGAVLKSQTMRAG